MRPQAPFLRPLNGTETRFNRKFGILSRLHWGRNDPHAIFRHPGRGGLVEFCDRQNFHFRWGDAVLRRVAARWPAAHGDRGAPWGVASSRDKPRVATPSIAPPSWRLLGGGL